MKNHLDIVAMIQAQAKVSKDFRLGLETPQPQRDGAVKERREVDVSAIIEETHCNEHPDDSRADCKSCEWVRQMHVKKHGEWNIKPADFSALLQLDKYEHQPTRKEIEE